MNAKILQKIKARRTQKMNRKIMALLDGKEVEIEISKESEEELERLRKKICSPCPFYKKECKGKCLIRC